MFGCFIFLFTTQFEKSKRVRVRERERNRQTEAARQIDSQTDRRAEAEIPSRL